MAKDEWADREFVLKAVKENGMALKDADDSLKADREVVLTAVRQDSEALLYAAESLQADREVVLAAVRHNVSDDTAFAPPPRAALVTGGAHRIGRAIALGLGNDGWAVAVHYSHSKPQAQEIVDEITGAGGRAVALAADLADEDETAGLVPRAAKALGPLGCLVNNASQFEADDPATATRESWDTHMEVNLRAPFVLTQGFTAQVPAETGGCVINIIDQRVWNLTPFFTTYTLSKAGLWTLTQTLALALAPRIRVNAIGPGPTLASARQTPAQFTRQWQSTPLQRRTPTEEICAAVRFLLSARAMTGQMMALDGGQHLGWAQLDRDYLPEE